MAAEVDTRRFEYRSTLLGGAFSSSLHVLPVFGRQLHLPLVIRL